MVWQCPKFPRGPGFPVQIILLETLMRLPQSPWNSTALIKALINTVLPRSVSRYVCVNSACSKWQGNVRLGDWCETTMKMQYWDTWAPSQYKDRLSRYGDSHVKDKPVVRPSYLKHENPYTGKTTSLYRDAPCSHYRIITTLGRQRSCSRVYQCANELHGFVSIWNSNNNNDITVTS